MRMPRWFYAVVALILEAVATRRDRQIRFLKAQIEILRGKLPGNRVIVDPEDRVHLLKLGQELDHQSKDILHLVSVKTYRHWVRAQPRGQRLAAWVVRLWRLNCETSSESWQGKTLGWRLGRVFGLRQLPHTAQLGTFEDTTIGHCAVSRSFYLALAARVIVGMVWTFLGSLAKAKDLGERIAFPPSARRFHGTGSYAALPRRRYGFSHLTSRLLRRVWPFGAMRPRDRCQNFHACVTVLRSTSSCRAIC